MSIKTFITTAVVSAIAAGSLLPIASAANARDYDGHRGGKGAYSKHTDQFNGHHRRWIKHGGKQYGYGGPRQHYGRHRDHTGRNIALGAFATILGIAIASEVSRDRGYDYRD